MPKQQQPNIPLLAGAAASATVSILGHPFPLYGRPQALATSTADVAAIRLGYLPGGSPILITTSSLEWLDTGADELLRAWTARLAVRA
jgi:uncharacterized membrane protein